MPHINLLPWREELRREQKRQFINVAAGAAIVMVGVIVLVHLRVSGIIEDQNNRNQFMSEQITQVDKEIAEIKTLEKEKEALLARMKVIQELQSSRPEIVHIFDELAKTIPDKVFLLSASRKDREISLEGVADSNDYVSEFMRNLNNSTWLTNPRLTVIQSDKKEYPGSSWFQLKVAQAVNKTEKADK
jgi:type IV pilus assembly protein PilN